MLHQTSSGQQACCCLLPDQSENGCSSKGESSSLLRQARHSSPPHEADLSLLCEVYSTAPADEGQFIHGRGRCRLTGLDLRCSYPHFTKPDGPDEPPGELYDIRPAAAGPLLSMAEIKHSKPHHFFASRFNHLSVRNFAMNRFSLPAIAATLVCSLTYALAPIGATGNLLSQASTCSCVECKCPDCNGGVCTCPTCECVGCGCRADAADATGATASLALSSCCAVASATAAASNCSCSPDECAAGGCESADCAAGVCHVK